ncbi:hypothetical protein [Staphylococcus agnetis]|uniref:hypothetical protein n=1 Tax=Staphylococcus agnetis TaxID=985762 RepID=UPI001F5B3CD9|nr:hypothetical protein [Staphylococcus agnetis]
MPKDRIWYQESYGYDNIIFGNEHEYQKLVIDAEFDFYKLALEHIYLCDLDAFHKKIKP